MHKSLSPRQGALTAPTVPSAPQCAGQAHPGMRHGESCTSKGLGLDFTEVFRCPPSLTARGMSEVSSAAAGKQIPLSYF